MVLGAGYNKNDQTTTDFHMNWGREVKYLVFFFISTWAKQKKNYNPQLNDFFTNKQTTVLKQIANISRKILFVGNWQKITSISRTETWDKNNWFSTITFLTKTFSPFF